MGDRLLYYFALGFCVRSGAIAPIHFRLPGQPHHDGVNAGVSKVWNSRFFHGCCLYFALGFRVCSGLVAPIPVRTGMLDIHPTMSASQLPAVILAVDDFVRFSVDVARALVWPRADCFLLILCVRTFARGVSVVPAAIFERAVIAVVVFVICTCIALVLAVVYVVRFVADVARAHHC